MNDLLDSVRALNPVPTCEQPSLEDVWCKLEREQASTVELDHASERCPTADVAAGRHVNWRQVWRPTGSRLAVAVVIAAAVLILIGAGRQASLLGETSPHGAATLAAVRRLAEGTISCDFASVGDARVGAIPARGRSAIAYCRNRYRATHRNANASQVAFIVCQTSATNVAVYIADGRPEQCHRLGDRVLPAGYAEAVRQTRTPGPTVSLSDRSTDVSV